MSHTELFWIEIIAAGVASLLLSWFFQSLLDRNGKSR
jgi:hypothetical protein